jgi:tetraacyldisaccharide 4'-kinase
MKLEAPPFWYNDDGYSAGWYEAALLPFSWFYQAGSALHGFLKKPRAAGVPIICVGNINIGGTGKTPTAIALMEVVKRSGLARNPAFLLRGYGGSLKGPLLVNAGQYSAAHVGEEALMLCKHAPTYVAADRYAGACYARENGVDLIIMDDGLQNRRLISDLKLVVVNGTMGFGNGHVFPAGPLRESVASGLAKTDAVILVGYDVNSISDIVHDMHVPLLQAEIATNPDFIPPREKRYLAFAGIGYPQKFYDYAAHVLGLTIVETHDFGDHHHYSSADIALLRDKAQAGNLALLTTEKDIQKLRSIPDSSGLDIHTIPIDLQFTDKDQIVSLLASAIGKGQDS